MTDNNRGLFSKLHEIKGKINQLKSSLENQTVRVAMGDDAIIVTVNGLQQIQELKLDPQKLPWNDQQRLAELIQKATNKALKEAQDMAKEEIRKIAGSLDIPGLGSLANLF